MSKKVLTREEVKKHITSLLVSAGCSSGTFGKTLTVRQLEDDFQMFIGCNLPVRQLGYTNIEEFLRDMSDVVQLLSVRGEWHVQGVSSKSTAHIEKLISSQRSAPKRGAASKPKGPPPRKFNTPRNAPPRYNNYQSRGGPPLRRYPQPHNRPAPPVPTIPAMVRGMVRDLLLSYPNGISVGPHFKQAFKRSYNEDLAPERFGCATLEQVLNCMDDILEMQVQPNGELKVKTKSLKPKLGIGRPMSGSAVVKAESNRAVHGIGRQNSGSSSNRGTTQDENLRSGHKTVPKLEQPEEDVLQRFEDDSGVSKEVQLTIQQVLSQYPKGLWSIYFPNEFKKLIGHELPVKRLGFHSLIEMMGALPHIVAIDRPGSNDWRLFDKRMYNKLHKDEPKPKPKVVQPPPLAKVPPKPKPQEQPPVSKKPASSLNPKFCETIRQVVAAYPNGVPLEQLAKRFLELTDCPFPMRELGFGSLDAMLQELMHVVQPQYQGPELGLVLKALPSDDGFKYNMLVNQPKIETTSTSNQESIPSDAIGPGSAFGILRVPAGQTQMEIFVGFIQSPDKFWLQIKGPKTTEALEDLMDKLEEFYYGPKSRMYKIPESLLMIGQVCVAIFPDDNNWHRTTITGFRGLDFVQVFFVDYGGTAWVHKENLRLLNSQFFRLPAQALVGRLSNIKPPTGDHWDPRASQLMLGLSANRPLYCLITNIDLDNKLSVCLCDTTGDTDVHINDSLVAKGLAIISFDQADSREGDVEGSPADNVETEMVAQTVFLKPMYLTEDHSFHVINIEQTGYVVGTEIALFIWQKDLLHSMLKQRKANFMRKVLTKEEHIQLFKEFIKHRVPGTFDGDLAKPMVTVYQLQDVPKILALFKHPTPQLIAAAKEAAETFHAGDPFWGGLDLEDEIEGSDGMSQASTEMSLHDWQNALDTLLMRRRRILQVMMDGATMPSNMSVEELKTIEEQMAEVRHRIREAETDVAGGGKKFSHEDEIIGACIDQQYAKTSSTSSSVAQKPVSVANSDVMKSVRTTNTVAPMPVSNTMTTATSNQSAGTVTSQSSQSGLFSQTGQSGPTTPATDSNQQMQNVLLQYQQLLFNQSGLQNQLLSSMMAPSQPQPQRDLNPALMQQMAGLGNQPGFGPGLMPQVPSLNLLLGAGLQQRAPLGRGMSILGQQQNTLVGNMAALSLSQNLQDGSLDQSMTKNDNSGS